MSIVYLLYIGRKRRSLTVLSTRILDAMILLFMIVLNQQTKVLLRPLHIHIIRHIYISFLYVHDFLRLQRDKNFT